jgi:hypothetical protein
MGLKSQGRASGKSSPRTFKQRPQVPAIAITAICDFALTEKDSIQNLRRNFLLHC